MGTNGCVPLGSKEYPPEIIVGEYLDCSENKSEVAKFIVDCAKAANPMSDEEGEDLVEACDKSAKSIFCKEVNGFCYRTNGRSSAFKPCSEALTFSEKEACGKVGN